MHEAKTIRWKQAISHRQRAGLRIALVPRAVKRGDAMGSERAAGTGNRGASEARANEAGELVKLRYRAIAPASVRGPVTARLYHFTLMEPVQAVDVRDADSILQTRLFGLEP